MLNGSTAPAQNFRGDSVGELNQRLCRAFEMKSERSDKPGGYLTRQADRTVKALGSTWCFITVQHNHRDHSSAHSNSLLSHLSTQWPGSGLLARAKHVFFCDVWHCDKRLGAGNMALGTRWDF